MNMLPVVAKELCKQFNKIYPVGTSVILVHDTGEAMETKTKWPASYREGHGATIGVDAFSGFWRLDRIIPVSKPDSGIVGKTFFVESPGFEGFAKVLGVSDDDTVHIRDCAGEIYIVCKDDLSDVSVDPVTPKIQ